MDLVDVLVRQIASTPDISAIVNVPRPMGPVGAPTAYVSGEDLIRALTHYMGRRHAGDFAAASALLAPAIASLGAEALSLRLAGLLMPHLLAAFPEAAGRPLAHAVVLLYAKYLNKDAADILALAAGKGAAETAWAALGPDDALSPEQLKSFYDQLSFPTGCSFRVLGGPTILIAQAALPLFVADRYRPRAAFDYGGSSGLLPLALRLAGAERTLLVEASRPLLDFARWRDTLLGVVGIDYREALGEPPEMRDLEGQFDFGICTEVLEHVPNVDDVVGSLAKLLRPGGMLFLSASFGDYPKTTHLARNTCFAGREDDLMRRHGLEPVSVHLPDFRRGNEKLYQRR